MSSFNILRKPSSGLMFDSEVPKQLENHLHFINLFRLGAEAGILS